MWRHHWQRAPAGPESASCDHACERRYDQPGQSVGMRRTLHSVGPIWTCDRREPYIAPLDIFLWTIPLDITSLRLDPQSEIWKKYGWLGKIWLIFGLAELSRKLKKSAKIRLNTKNLRLKFSWLQTILAELLNLNWNDCQREWLLSVSLMLQNLHPSVLTRSFEIMRIIHFK